MAALKRTRADPPDFTSPPKRLKPNSTSSQLENDNGDSSSPAKPWYVGKFLSGAVKVAKHLWTSQYSASTANGQLPTPAESRASLQSAPSLHSPFSSPSRRSPSSKLSNALLDEKHKKLRHNWLIDTLDAQRRGVPMPAMPHELTLLQAELRERQKSKLPRRAAGSASTEGVFQRKKPMGHDKKQRLRPDTLFSSSASRNSPLPKLDPLPPVDDIPYISLRNPRPSSPRIASPPSVLPDLRSPSPFPPPQQLVQLSPSELLLAPVPPFAPSWDPSTYSPPAPPSPHLRPRGTPSLSSLVPSPRDEIDDIFSLLSPASPSSIPPSLLRGPQPQHKILVAQRDLTVIHALQNGAHVNGLSSSSGSNGSIAAEADEDDSFLYGGLSSQALEREKMELYERRVAQTADQEEQGISTDGIKIKRGHSLKNPRTTTNFISPQAYFPAASPFLRPSAPPKASKIPLLASSKGRQGSSRSTDELLGIAKKSMQEPLAGHEKERLEGFEKMQRELDELRRKDEEEEAAASKRQKRRVFPSRHTSENLKIINAAFSNRSFESAIKGAVVAAGDLARLKGSTWLNDEVINFIGVSINLRAEAAEKKREKEKEGAGEGERNGGRLRKAFCFNTNFYSMLTQGGVEKGFEKVKRWTRRFDTFAKDIIIVPINLGGSHWVCAAVNIEKKRIEYYDSLGSPRPAIYANLRKWLEKEHQSRKGSPIDLSDWEDYWDDDRPSQENTHDCGVFTCMFMETLSRDFEGFDFVQDDMDYLRKKLCLVIAQKDLGDLEPWE